MIKSHLFEGMEFSEDHDKLREWVPLIMRSRSASEKLAATRATMGTDVDFGALTKNW